MQGPPENDEFDGDFAMMMAMEQGDGRGEHRSSSSAAAVVSVMEAEAESLLLFALGQDYGEQIFKYVSPHTAGLLECVFSRELVFVPAGKGDALLRIMAGRRHTESAKKSGVKLVPLGPGREGRVTWAMELLWIHLAVVRARGAKNMISAGANHSLVTTGNAGELLSFGKNSYSKLGHGGWGREVVPRLIEVLARVVVKQVAAGMHHSMALTSEGRVFTWGLGQSGQLGHGNQDQMVLLCRSKWWVLPT